MNSFRTRSGRTGIAAAAVVALAACGGGSGSGAGASGQGASDTLTIGLDADAAPTGYDPLAYAQRQSEFFSPLYDSLFVTTAEGGIEGSLVTDVSNNEDDTQTTLTLRDDVTFDDGSSLDAELVKANLDRRDDPELQSYGSLAEGEPAELTDVTVQDPQTVVLTWAQPQATPEANLAGSAGMILSAEGVADPASLETRPAGSGPYDLSESGTTRASQYTLEKDAEHWNAEAWAFDTIAYRVITDPQALANAVISGQVDVAGQLKGNAIDQVESQANIVSIGGTVVGMPVLDKTGAVNPAFATVEARHAIMHAIDREKLVADLHPGARPTSQLFPEEVPGFDPALDEEFAYDPERAKQLLAEAGYPDGFEFNATVLGQPEEDQVAVQSMLAEVGITMNFVTATSTDQVFASVRTDPTIWGPFAVGARPEGFVAGAMYGGFMNYQKAEEPAIAKPMGAALGTTGEAQEQARTDLNRAIAEKGWFIGAYEDLTYYGYDAEAVTEPSFAGQDNWLVVSSIQPA